MTRPAPGDVIPGTLDMLILKAISLGERMHGYGIADFLQRTSRDVVRVEEGALYPALHRLEVRGWLRSEWGTSDNNRRAKYYSLTAIGRRELEREASSWEQMAAAIARIMQSRS
jgi:PadR family transcriptional regulator PadR